MNKRKKAFQALQFIIPIIKRYNFRWMITGGFASYVYGVKRPITDIDIDIQTSKNHKKFKGFLNELKPFITQRLEHFNDINYDYYNFEITYHGQLIDICPSKELRIFNKRNEGYVSLYGLFGGFPKPKIIKWYGLRLPLLPKQMIIKNKEMLIWKRKPDYKDINGLDKINR